RSIKAILPFGFARYGSPAGKPGVPGGQPRPTWTTSPDIVLFGNSTIGFVNAPSTAGYRPAIEAGAVTLNSRWNGLKSASAWMRSVPSRASVVEWELPSWPAAYAVRPRTVGFAGSAMLRMITPASQ